MQNRSWSRQVFQWFNYVLLGFLGLLCILPLIHVLAVSFSSNAAATGGLVKFWPVGFNWKSYEFVMSSDRFLKSLVVTLERVALGGGINMLLTLITAYPLSKESERFKPRTLYAWFFMVTILFSGGLIPLFMVVRETGIMGSIWALILPGAVPVFNIILLLNFFRGLPREMEEAAFIDGAGHLSTLFRVFVPLSLPALATITLLTVVSHWNAWFDGLIFMNSPDRYPLQSYLQTIVIKQDFTNMTEQDLKNMRLISDRTIKSAQIFLGSLPILLVYPFLQKYFVTGMTLGSVKD
ncbi:carbohydrate ABC transporter permease [Paenibacillus sp. LHD-117]|uniref:carbohydrate ABC transporter permease n=1 Tax=Paenibacillus sp. LHD-117 TaxID=3071412 RepID=UPI0027DED4D6|nr:carbohydrate ABC transporter permease [Paenibacillus sp. LHD-117]MDQ6419720.1 carbohydrate ABC transporter permease [Paenibacillus sp. LHD-117]